MPARRRSRQRALQVLFLWDVRRQPVADVLTGFYASLYSAEEEESTGAEPPEPARDAFLDILVNGAIENIDELDRLICLRAENWRLDRMPVVDRNVLRLAIYEMKYQGTPPAVVIDEALELARRYSEEDAVPFINGVLDAIRKIIFPEAPDAGATSAPPSP